MKGLILSAIALAACSAAYAQPAKPVRACFSTRQMLLGSNSRGVARFTFGGCLEGAKFLNSLAKRR